MSRRDLLPPYLDNLDIWTDLADTIDAVWALPIDVPKKYIQYLRETHLLSQTTLDSKIEVFNIDPVLDSAFVLDQTTLDAEAQSLLKESDFDTWEREILIKQASMLGFSIKQPSLLTDDDYRMLTRNLALYWYSKGSPDFIKFLSFVFNTVLEIKNLWANTSATYDSYGAFLPEGDPGIGTSVVNGGTWFPTTHVDISYEPIGTDPGIAKFLALFNALANYNLVIHSITVKETVYFHSYNGYKYVYTGGSWKQVDNNGVILDQLDTTFVLDTSLLASPPENFSNIIMMYPLTQVDVTIYTVGQLDSTFVLDSSQLA